MGQKKRQTAMAVFVEGKWLIGLPTLPGQPVQPARIRLPLPERAPRRPKPSSGSDPR